MVPGPTVSASPENLWEMQITSTQLRPPESETTVGVLQSVF